MSGKFSCINRDILNVCNFMDDYLTYTYFTFYLHSDSNLLSLRICLCVVSSLLRLGSTYKQDNCMGELWMYIYL